jgi:hypothetical protein
MKISEIIPKRKITNEANPRYAASYNRNRQADSNAAPQTSSATSSSTPAPATSQSTAKTGYYNSDNYRQPSLNTGTASNEPVNTSRRGFLGKLVGGAAAVGAGALGLSYLSKLTSQIKPSTQSSTVSNTQQTSNKGKSKKDIARDLIFVGPITFAKFYDLLARNYTSILSKHNWEIATNTSGLFSRLEENAYFLFKRGEYDDCIRLVEEKLESYSKYFIGNVKPHLARDPRVFEPEFLESLLKRAQHEVKMDMGNNVWDKYYR